MIVIFTLGGLVVGAAFGHIATLAAGLGRELRRVKPFEPPKDGAE